MTRTPAEAPRKVLVAAFVALVLEGYDLTMFGTVVPSLLAEWDVSPDDVGRVASLGVCGMLVGALAASYLNNRFSQRLLLVTSVMIFSTAMALSVFITTLPQLGLLRFIVGLGTGALMPTSVALVIEHSPPGKRGLNSAISFAGVGVGGCLAGLLGAMIVPEFGFRPMFAIGAAPAIIVIPIIWRLLPRSIPDTIASDESVDYVSARTRIAQLFGRGYLTITLLFSASVFFCLLIVFGANAWLPTLMIQSGYGVSSSLVFLLVLNIGATVGALVASPIADRFGFARVIVVSFAAAALSFAALALEPNTPVVVALIAFVGLGSNGTQILINAFVGSHYPPELRSAAIGVALGIGRIGGIVGPAYGALLVVDTVSTWQFLGWAGPAVVGALTTAAIPTVRHITRRRARSGLAQPSAVARENSGPADEPDFLG